VVGVENRGPAGFGILVVPESVEGGKSPGFIVDGQQRLAAIASCTFADFPVFVTAMIAPDIDEQRKQFVLVNRTKPLPQGLIFELLPAIHGVLPDALARQRISAAISARLNLDWNSSLFRQIKTPTCPVGNIKDNSIKRMVINSLSDGALYLISQEKKVMSEFMDKTTRVVSDFWKAVSITFRDAWNLPPHKSRLTHGVGVAAMGFVMDHLYCERYDASQWNPAMLVDTLDSIRMHCAWTKGEWRFDGHSVRQWNELQNTEKDIRLLTNHFRRLMQ